MEQDRNAEIDDILKYLDLTIQDLVNSKKKSMKATTDTTRNLFVTCNYDLVNVH